MRLDRILRTTTRRRSLTSDQAAAAARRIERLPADRLAAGPGLVAAAFGLDTSWTGLDLCDPSSPAPPRGAPASEPAPVIAATPRIGVDYAGEPWATAVAVRRSRPPVGLRARLSGCDDDGPSLRGAARVPGRPGTAGRRHLVPAVAPPRRGPRAVERPGHRRARPRRDRPGTGARPGPAGRRDRRGPRHRTGRSSGPPAAAGSTRTSSSRSPTTLDATTRLATLLADERRPLLRELGRELHALPALRSTLARSFDPVGRAARHGLAAARRPARGRPGRLRPAAAAARRARRRRARERAPGADHHAPQRPLRRAGQGRGAVAGQGHRPRRLGQRPDPVHRAARRGRAGQCLARGAGRRGRGDRAHPRRAVGARRGQRRRRCARRSTRSPGSTCGSPRRALAAEMDGSRAGDRRRATRRSCCRRVTRA